MLVDIPLAKIYTPSTEEFKDPMAYLESIKEEAEHYGIIKIIPPNEFKPPFCLEQNKKVIRTRKQHLNEIEASTRLKLHFNHNIAVLMEILPVLAVNPIINNRIIDLYELYTIVEECGGFEQILKKDNKFYYHITKKMCFSTKYVSNIKSAIIRLLYPYFCLYKTLIQDSIDKSDHYFDKSSHFNAKKTSKRSIKSKSTCFKCGNKYFHGIKSPSHKTVSCIKCKKFFHKESCIVDYLECFANSPRFICEYCVIDSFQNQAYDNTYAFIESKDQVYTLNEFKKKADAFKLNFFKKKKHHNVDDVEAQFWTLLSHFEHDIEVEYGADLASSAIGSGFPSSKSKNDTPLLNYNYKTTYWNLNNLPNHPKSTLRYIKENISGIKVPWVYVGMLFSCFCWHVEDHWSCSINYNHTGAIKTWYGIPMCDADKFEHLVKNKYSTLFINQKDLLHQLVTLVNPTLIKNSNINIFKIHQKAGEFVVTFSRSYHAGFNHGFNVAEAVNFCFDDWISIARNAVISYQCDIRTPVFSHDAFVIELTNQLLANHSISWDDDTITWSDKTKTCISQPLIHISSNLLKNTYEELVGMVKRIKSIEDFPYIENVIIINDKTLSNRSSYKNSDTICNDSDDVLCSQCKTICFLGYISCNRKNCEKKILCDTHRNIMCKCDNTFKTK